MLEIFKIIILMIYAGTTAFAFSWIGAMIVKTVMEVIR